MRFNEALCQSMPPMHFGLQNNKWVPTRTPTRVYSSFFSPFETLSFVRSTMYPSPSTFLLTLFFAFSTLRSVSRVSDKVKNEKKTLTVHPFEIETLRFVSMVWINKIPIHCLIMTQISVSHAFLIKYWKIVLKFLYFELIFFLFMCSVFDNLPINHNKHYIVSIYLDTQQFEILYWQTF